MKPVELYNTLRYLVSDIEIFHTWDGSTISFTLRDKKYEITKNSRNFLELRFVDEDVEMDAVSCSCDSSTIVARISFIILTREIHALEADKEELLNIIKSPLPKV